METFNHINLRIKKVKNDDLVQALRGQKIPRALGEERTRRCVIRGIRYHHGFGTELRGLLPEFTRALNARSIMSNEIPDMNPEYPEEFPYCIWHPNIASVATYRELAKRYPHMKYLVGRACAVAGYTELFHELDLLPECHIAEEARESGHMAIYDAIMKTSVKYNAMNDYTREILTPVPGNLNGDTAIRSYLNIRFTFDKGWYSNTNWLMSSSYHGLHWAMDDNNCDITEDRRVDESDTDPETTPFAIKDEEILPMLYNPLPADLPTLNKDLLVLTAAFYGDVDRYARLRRPQTVRSELDCLLRGIYNNTMFAMWCSLQKNSTFQYNGIKAAIHARFIMNGDLSRITPDTPDNELPYLIWYPSIPRKSVLRELFRRQPTMKPAIARTCIIADYEDLYDLLDADPDTEIMEEARDSRNPHYIQDLEAKIPQRGYKPFPRGVTYEIPRKLKMFEHPPSHLWINSADSGPNLEEDGISYNGSIASFKNLQLSVSAPDLLKRLVAETHCAIEIDEYYDSLRHEIQVHERLGNNEGIMPPTCPSEYRTGATFAKKNNLEFYLATHPEPEESFKINWILSLTKTFSYVHSRRVFINQIYLSNILVIEDELKLTNFTESILLPPTAQMDTVCEDELTAKTEILQLGWIIYSIATWRVHNYRFFNRLNTSWPTLESFPPTDDLFCGRIVGKCWREEYDSMDALNEEAHSLLQQTFKEC
ncbi:hypothetical protein N7445_007909 [Penicillium cf. griseofulvum]|nr:hypothetical protein N7445_007909 [Penicillium cf. griseofulvum]